MLSLSLCMYVRVSVYVLWCAAFCVGTLEGTYEIARVNRRGTKCRVTCSYVCITFPHAYAVFHLTGQDGTHLLSIAVCMCVYMCV